MSFKSLLLSSLAFCASFASAAELVARFNEGITGEKSLGYVVTSRNNGGFYATSSSSWSQSDYTTILVKYSNLPSSGDQALMTLAQSNDGSKLSKVGLASRDGKLYGIWEGNVWTNGETKGGELPSEGTIVFVYKPVAGSGNPGVVAYDATGALIYQANGLKSTGTGITVGGRFDFGANASGALVQSGFAITRAEVYHGELSAEEIPAAVAAFEKKEVETSFDWTCTQSPTGWIQGWSGEASGGDVSLVGTDGTVVKGKMTGSWNPWAGNQAPKQFLFSVYGTADFVATPESGKYAILWGLGTKSGSAIALAKDSNGEIVVVEITSGGNVARSISAGVVAGYHLITVAFDATKGCGIYVDAEAGVWSSTFKTAPSAGFQIGSLHGGVTGQIVKGNGFLPQWMHAADDAFVPMIQILAAAHPAVTRLSSISATGVTGSVYVPAVELPQTITLAKGATLLFPTGVATAPQGTLTIDLTDTPEIGDQVFLKGEADFSGLMVQLTIQGKPAPANIALDADGAIVDPSSGLINERDESTMSWVIDTTDGAYKLSSAEIEELKKKNWTLTLRSSSTESALIDFGDQSTEQAAHYVVESGTHTLKWFGTVQKLDFDARGTMEDPSIRVKSGATLDFYVRDLTGWNNDAKATRSNVIYVESGATLNFRANGTSTFYYQGLLYLEPGARVTANGFSDKLRLNGGIYEDAPQIIVPAATGEETTVTYTTNSSVFRFASNETNGYAVQVGKGSTLILTGDFSSDGARDFGKFGSGTVQIDGSFSAFSGVVKLYDGVLRVRSNAGLKRTSVETKDGETRHLLVSDDGTWTTYSFEPPVARVGETEFVTLRDALEHVTDGSVLEILDASIVYEDGVFKQNGETIVDPAAIALELTPREDGAFDVKLAKDDAPMLRISEIMPKPTDGEYDVNGLTSGWIELVNTGDKWVNLADYKIIRVNRGKKTDTTAFSNLCTRWVAPGARTLVYTSERYPNGDKDNEGLRAFTAGCHDGATVETYDDPSVYGVDLHGVMVFPDKINPKKFPFVRLYHAPEGVVGEVQDTVVIPADLPESYSIVLEEAAEGESTKRFMCANPTPGAANGATTDLRKLGPNVGPLYENETIKKGVRTVGAKHDSSSEFARLAPPAQYGEDYEVVFSANPVMAPTGGTGVEARDEDRFEKIVMIVRTDLDDKTTRRIEVDLDTKTTDTLDWGDSYTAKIPQEMIDALKPGHLIQWKFELTDKAGSVWTSPSFNQDVLADADGYEWYGTITQPEANQLSGTLVTYHLFGDAAVSDIPGKGSQSALMNIDESSSSFYTATHPHGGRVGIYDSSTSNYYDFVRIDRRGNSSSGFRKKSHGLRFAKTHPLKLKAGFVDSVPTLATGKDVEVRKTSFIAEYGDPTYLRQLTAFWLFNRNGSLCPYSFPVRVNLNGEFYQLAFNSHRFTDELVEDIYGLNKYGYAYKNAGPYNGQSQHACSTEKKTPDDGNEKDLKVWQDFCATLPTSQQNDNAAYTRNAVEKLDLAAWLNYIALSRITSECDDLWANLSGFYDNPKLLQGELGTGTWKPLGYDMQLTFGQYHYGDLNGYRAKTGIFATMDWFKSHPLYGGWAVRAHRTETSDAYGNANRVHETIFQSTKFRRLLLRRLRTLMDKELGAPGAEEPAFFVKMRETAALMEAEAVEDRKLWGDASNASTIDVWGSSAVPKTIDEGLTDIWENYVVPRRVHLYETHAANSTTLAQGYGTAFAAGIPAAQRPVLDLREGISATYDAAIGAVVIKNANADVIDLSGWKLAGPVAMTLPEGTILDGKIGETDGEVYVTADRKTTIKAMTLTDQVIIGNGEETSSETISLTAADGTKVIFTPTNEYHYLRLHSFDGCTAVEGGDTEEWITLTNLSQDVTLELKDVRVRLLKTGDDPSAAKCDFMLAGGTLKPGESIRLEQGTIGWGKITNNQIDLALWDANAVLVQSGAITQKNYKSYYGDLGSKTGVQIGGKFYLQAVAFTETLEQATFSEVPYPVTIVPVAPGEDVVIAADSAEDALAKAELTVETPLIPGLTEETYKSYFKLIAEQTPKGYRVSAVLDATKIAAPLIGAHEEVAHPFAVSTNEAGEIVISIGVTNAKIGLWYGYEVSESLNAAFTPDPDSFIQARGEKIVLVGAKRKGPAAFYRVKVMAVAPTK